MIKFNAMCSVPQGSPINEGGVHLGHTLYLSQNVVIHFSGSIIQTENNILHFSNSIIPSQMGTQQFKPSDYALKKNKSTPSVPGKVFHSKYTRNARYYSFSK